MNQLNARELCKLAELEDAGRKEFEGGDADRQTAQSQIDEACKKLRSKLPSWGTKSVKNVKNVKFCVHTVFDPITFFLFLVLNLLTM